MSAFMMIFISCKAVSIDNEKEKQTKLNIDSISNVPNSDLFLGSWNLLKTITTKIEYKNGSTISTESTTVCNVCPTIIFKTSEKGIIVNAAGIETFFKWTLSNENKIYFSFEKKSDESSFFSSDKVFSYKIYNDSKNSYIELSEYTKKYKYILVGNLTQTSY